MNQSLNTLTSESLKIHMSKSFEALTSDSIKAPVSDPCNSDSLKTWTDEELWASTIKETETERNSTLKVISYLQEINLRRLHLKRGYPHTQRGCQREIKYGSLLS